MNTLQAPPAATPHLTRTARPPHPFAPLVLALLLGACASVAPPPLPPPAPVRAPPPAGSPTEAAPAAPAPAAQTPPPIASPRTAVAEGLAIEQRWLQEWFRGTPVRIALRSDGVLAVDVPREFCFDSGSSQLKPALAAVLDKVAESLKRRSGTQLSRLSAPADVAGNAAATALAVQRAAAVQRHLRQRGIASARLGEAVAEGTAAVQLRISSPMR